MSLAPAEEKVHFQEAALVLADGAVFHGELVAPEPGTFLEPICGEVVFNTSMTGYQEIITDPSYSGQIVTFTFPHLGNYGINPSDFESARPHCSAVIARDVSTYYSNWRASEGLISYLSRHQVAILTGIDTRALTKHIRSHGALPGAIGTLEVATLRKMAESDGGTEGKDLVKDVSTREIYEISGGSKRVVAIDFGVKRTILDQLSGFATVIVVPASIGAEEILAMKPDGVFLSNGPGDPAAVDYGVDTIRQLIGRVPIFGICLGHQLLAQAIGAKTYKMDFGHHGGNHPVQRLADKVVEITSQNHNYAVDADSFGVLGLRVEGAHRNLNDNVIEGFRVPELDAFSVQYHPEAGPGP
ncbi:MAG: glutamine-hydrolyzing carbamoyl-phosphate synthase small subunit, partial [Acidimicrobiaceae bacterium]|nr:glutamine-hydrolyzing carbamoyl-phosphate synthase small subunit [Acidimicrobiaceae bacterium]